MTDIRKVKDMNGLIGYFANRLEWKIDLDDFDDIDDIAYDFEAGDIGLKEEAFAKIESLRQLPPLVDGQKWGIFCVEFAGRRFEVTALRKILSGLIEKKNRYADHKVWDKHDLLFICFWGKGNDRTIGLAHFEDKEKGLPQIRMIHCAPAVEDFTQINNFEDDLAYLRWSDTQGGWEDAFVTGYHEVIRDSSTLTLKLAEAAQGIRRNILSTLDVETKDGYVHKLYEKFKNTLIHDMSVTQFADMYAQTVVYGLFSARCMDETQEDFSAEEAIQCIPNTNPFLKSLMVECLGAGSDSGLSFDELEVGNVVDLLLHTDTERIIRDFNRQTGGGREDPVIHFYEEFLSAYDREQRVQRGVYYTPQPVVNFIVRAVDSILKDEFGLADGLASEETKYVKYTRESKKKVNGIYTEVEDEKRVPTVQILDPATGTGTFLRQTILQIYNNFCQKHAGKDAEEIQKLWNIYVPRHLLPRLNGFELMMAPYAVAHMKLAMVLKDTGYEFKDDTRLNVFLTNTLEEAGEDSLQGSFFGNDPLALESSEANAAKKNNGINVIIGNPPYNVSSTNKNNWIIELLQEYKKGLTERKLNLDDDYIKFLRFSQVVVEKADKGVIGFITNNSFVDGITHRQIRKSLVNTFDKIYIINLHGNIMAHEKCSDGSKDENVFDITQGVSIFLGVRTNSKEPTAIYYYDLMGLRDHKYKWLYDHNMDQVNWETIEPDDDMCMFIPVDSSNKSVYDNGFSVLSLYNIYNSGIETKCDELSVKDTQDELKEVINNFISMDVDSLKKLYYFKEESTGWNFANAKQELMTRDYFITTFYYRPFDFKYTVYTGKSGGFIGRSRDVIMRHLINHPENYSLCLMRQFFQDVIYNHVFISNLPIDKRTMYSNRGGAFLFPLYVYNEDMGKITKSYNFQQAEIKKIEKALGLKLSYNVEKNCFTGTDLVDYIYATLYSRKYREKYNSFLKIDFPRVPYPTDKDTFFKLVGIGAMLRECHLMHTGFNTAAYSFVGSGSNEVVKPEYKNGRVYINSAQYFDNVPQAQWEQYIGGYQPLQKWLKDRKKRTLSDEDVEHYKKIIAALKRTEELMAEIDTVVSF